MLATNAGEQTRVAGAMAAFPAGEPDGHHLVNRSATPAIYLEVGDRTANDRVEYPDHDLIAKGDPNGGWQFTHRDGSPYSPD